MKKLTLLFTFFCLVVCSSWAVTGPHTAQIRTLHSIQELIALRPSTASVSVSVDSFYKSQSSGGGNFIWDAATSKSLHNGGTIIDPLHTATPGDTAWFSPVNTANGVWKRQSADVINLSWFGPKSTGGGDALIAAAGVASMTKTLLLDITPITLDKPANLRGVKLDGEHASIMPTAGSHLTLGGYSSTYNPPQSLGNFGTGASIYIKGGNYQNFVFGKIADYLRLYADSDVSGGGSNSYSHYTVRQAGTILLQTNPAPAGSLVQYNNQNRFDLGRINAIQITGTYDHNGNQFYGGTFEIATITLDVGQNNHFHELRPEGPGVGEEYWRKGLVITCASGTFNNTFEVAHLQHEPVFINNGSRTNHWWKKGEHIETVVAWSGLTISDFRGIDNVTSTSTIFMGCEVATTTLFYASPYFPAQPLDSISLATLDYKPYTMSNWFIDVVGASDASRGKFILSVLGVASDGSNITPDGTIDLLAEGYPSGVEFENGLVLSSATADLDSMSLCVVNPDAKYVRFVLSVNAPPAVFQGATIRRKYYTNSPADYIDIGIGR